MDEKVLTVCQGLYISLKYFLEQSKKREREGGVFVFTCNHPAALVCRSPARSTWVASDPKLELCLGEPASGSPTEGTSEEGSRVVGERGTWKPFLRCPVMASPIQCTGVNVPALNIFICSLLAVRGGSVYPHHWSPQAAQAAPPRPQPLCPLGRVVDTPTPLLLCCFRPHRKFFSPPYPHLCAALHNGDLLPTKSRT